MLRKLYYGAFEIEKTVNQLKQTGFDFGLITGSWTQFSTQKLGGRLEGNPLVVRLQQLINFELEEYARAKSGAAIPDVEWDRFLTQFPGFSRNEKVNDAMIDGLKSFTYKDVSFLYEDMMGSRDAARFAYNERLSVKGVRARKYIKDSLDIDAKVDDIRANLKKQGYTDLDVDRLWVVKGKQR